MNLRAVWSRLTTSTGGARRVHPALVLLAIGGGAIALLVATASRFGRVERVALDANAKFTVSEFQAAQAEWKKQGLNAARFAAGIIQVPADQADQYRHAWRPADSRDERSRWADVWQQANDRLSQFSSSRERDAAREISRAQVVSRLLEEMPDVESADIVWDEGAAPGWRESQRVRATVYLQAAAGRSIGPDVVDAVRKAVSGSKANLAPEDVTVMDQTRMVAYGANDASLVDVRTAQLVAQFRTRLAAAVEHIPGVRVEVHANAGGVESSAAPIVVSIGIPETSLLTLAKLENSPHGEGLDQQKRREVFRSVEQHVHRSVSAKVQQLIPTGLILAAPEHLVVETLPSPAVPAEQRQAIVAPAIAAWLEQHGLIIFAACCGLGAVSMLWPRRRSAGVGTHAVTSAPVATPAVEPNPLSVADLSQVTNPQAAALAQHEPMPTSEESPGTLTQIHRQDLGDTARIAEVPREPRMLTASATGRLSAPPVAEQSSAPTKASQSSRTDLLRDVLTRLDQQRGHSTGVPSTAAPEVHSTAAAAAQVFSARTSDQRLTNARWESLDLEQLQREDPNVLRALVQQVEVEVWMRALFGASPELRGRILPCLPPDQARQLNAGLQSTRPVRLREIDAAQQEVFGVWSRLRQIPPLGLQPPALAAPRRPAA